MAFASLQEAWGVPTLTGGETRPQPQPAPRFEAAFEAAFEPMASAAPYSAPPPPPPPAKARPAAQAKKPAAKKQARQPAEGDDEASARRVLELAYRRAGAKGVLALLPAAAVRGLSRRRSGRRRPTIWAWLARTLADPDTVLFLLVLAFVVLVAWDGCGSSDVVPSLTSLHMSPFALGTSAM